jgi:hypothetical protein
MEWRRVRPTRWGIHFFPCSTPLRHGRDGFLVDVPLVFEQVDVLPQKTIARQFIPVLRKGTVAYLRP